MKPPKRYITTESDKLAIKQGCYWRPEKAEIVCKFFSEFLRHSKGEFAGQPFELLKWQVEDLVYPIFAWYRKDGTRRFRRCYIEIPKKNGKSTLAAGLALYLLMEEPGAQVCTAAADREQASIVFSESAHMVEQSPFLSRAFEIIRSQKRIVFHRTKSWYRALSADAPTKEGLNIHGLIFDELHAQPDRKLWDALAYGSASRRQPLWLSITTAGVYDPESIGWEQHDYASKVLDGSIQDTSFFAYIRAARSDDDWRSPAVHKRANPSWGVTVNPDHIKEACVEAQNEPRKQVSFQRYHLNIWAQTVERWLSAEDWRELYEEIDDATLRSWRCFGGLDLARTTDTSSLAVVFQKPDDGGYYAKTYFWCPEEAGKERERRNQPMYLHWMRDGWMTATDGNVTDYNRIRADIRQICDRYKVEEIAYDPYNADMLAGLMASEDGIETIEFRQGILSMNEPSKELERLVRSGRITHDGNPVMNWMIGNSAIESDAAGNIKPSKRRAREKIDGVVATIMGLGRAMKGGPKLISFPVRTI